MNKPESKKERNLLKGAIRRVFSRSDLRRKIVELTVVQHEDKTRPRVKTWCKCPSCLEFVPKSYLQVDHIEPIIRLNESLDDLDWNTIIDRVWCEENNLVAICKPCHETKTKAEAKERRRLKKERK